MKQASKYKLGILFLYLIYTLIRNMGGYISLKFPGYYLAPIILFVLPIFVGAVFRILMLVNLDEDNENLHGIRFYARSSAIFYMRFIVVDLLTWLAYFIPGYIASLLVYWPEQDIRYSILTMCFSIPSLMVFSVWLTAIVAERDDLVPSFWRATHALIGFAPVRKVAAISAISITLINFLMAYLQKGKDFLPNWLSFVFAVLFAIIFYFSYFYSIKTFKQALQDYLPNQFSQKIKRLHDMNFDDDWMNSSVFHASLLSFIPPFNFIAAILGWKCLKKRKSFSLKAYGGLVFGGCFTLIYAVLLCGMFLLPKPDEAAQDFDLLRSMKAIPSEALDAIKRKDFFTAESILDTALAKTSTSEVRFAYAVTLYSQGFNHDCVDQFKILEKEKKLTAPEYFMYGKALMKAGYINLASQKFSSALSIDSNFKMASNYLELTENGLEPSKNTNIAWTIGLFIILLSFHEFGHAYASKELGDSTAESEGRLTLDPISHVDPIGSILFPVIMMLSSSLVIGWARPVPVDLRNLKNQERDHMRIALAGPAMNFALALIIFTGLALFMAALKGTYPGIMTMDLDGSGSAIYIAGVPGAKTIGVILLLCRKAMFTSMFLGFFNLLPFGPLDGYAVLRGFIPLRWLRKFDSLQEYQGLLFLIMIFTPAVSYMMAIPKLFMNLAFHSVVATVGLS